MKKNPFKVGDKLKCLSTTGQIIKDELVVVSEVQGNFLKFEGYKSYLFHWEHFEKFHYVCLHCSEPINDLTRIEVPLNDDQAWFCSYHKKCRDLILNNGEEVKTHG